LKVLLLSVLVVFTSAAATSSATQSDSDRPHDARMEPVLGQTAPLTFSPLMFDDFNRSVSGAWGTSSSGPLWVDNSFRENG
jgi:hypothetical protein